MDKNSKVALGVLGLGAVITAVEPDGSEVYVGPGVPYYIDSSGWLYLE